MKTKSNIVQSIAAMSFIAVQTSLHAADQTWIDANPNNNWNTATDLNWDAGVAWTQGNNAIFGGTGETVALATGITIGNMTFNSAGYTISGNTLTLGSASVLTAYGDATISSVLTSGTNAVFTKEGTGTLTLTGVNTLGNGNQADVTINAGTLKVTGTGVLFSNNSVAASVVTIHTGGTLEVDRFAWGADTSFGKQNFNSGNLVLNGGILRYSGADNVSETNNARGFMIGANGGTLSSAATSGGTWRLPNGGITSSSGGTLTLDGASNGQLDSALGGSGGLTKTGSGAWTLTNGNSYAGSTTVNEGKLILARGDNAGQVIATASAIAINNTGTVEVGSDNNINSNAFTVNAGGTLNMAAGKTAWLQGSLTLAGGTLASTDGGFGGTETFILNPTGGTVTVNGNTTSTISAQNVLLGNNSTLTFNVADGTAAVDLNVTGNLKNNGTSGLNKSGTGTMVLAGTNTYTGATAVNEGKLVIGVANFGSITSNVTVASGATLGGSGAITGNVVVNGTHTPGNSAGIQTVTGNLSYGATSIFDWELTANTSTQGTSPSYTFDQVNMPGASDTLSIAAGAKIKLILNAGVAFSDGFWASDRSWNIFTNASTVTGNFLINSISNDSAGNAYTLAHPNGHFSMSGATLSWTAVPEPTSALVGMLLGVGLLRRRRN